MNGQAGSVGADWTFVLGIVGRVLHVNWREIAHIFAVHFQTVSIVQ